MTHPDLPPAPGGPPDGETPNGMLPGGILPGDIRPNAGAPNDVAPDGGPSGDAPGGDASDGGLADDGAPLDPALLAAARAYHAPPPVPADAMWAAIQARRGARAGAPATTVPLSGPASDVADEFTVRRLDGRGRATSGGVRRWAPLAAAAVLLVAVGVGIGRTTAPASNGAAVAVAPPPAPPNDTPAPAPAVASTTLGAPEPPNTTAPGSRGASAPTGLGAMGGRARRNDDGFGPPSPRTRAPKAPANDALVATAPAAPSPDAASAPLRAATEQHLARAEALLTAFAASPAGVPTPAPPAPDSLWARDLLTTTRLLLDSPAAADPTRRGLLEALELVLVQIARLPRADSPGERALIDRAIRQGDLMARLRGAVPAGAAAAPASLGT